MATKLSRKFLAEKYVFSAYIRVKPAKNSQLPRHATRKTLKLDNHWFMSFVQQNRSKRSVHNSVNEDIRVKLLICAYMSDGILTMLDVLVRKRQ
jgi:hypothetical protein